VIITDFPNGLNSEELLKILTKEFIEQVESAKPENLGIYRTLKILAERAEIKELSIFLCLAENAPVKIETLVDLLKDTVSKSTIYRKIPEYEEKELVIKNSNGYLELGDSIKSLKVLSNINKKIEGE